jgi:hypothetical protein
VSKSCLDRFIIEVFFNSFFTYHTYHSSFFSAINEIIRLAVPDVILQAAYKELEQFNGEPQQPALHDKVSFDNLSK